MHILRILALAIMALAATPIVVPDNVMSTVSHARVMDDADAGTKLGQ